MHWQPLGAESMMDNPLIKDSKGILFLAPTGLKSIMVSQATRRSG